MHIRNTSTGLGRQHRSRTRDEHIHFRALPDQFACSTTLTSTTALADQIYTTFFFLASITLSLDSVGVVAMCVVVVGDFKTPKVGLNFVPKTGVLGSILGFPLSLAVSPAGTEIDKKLPLIREKLPCMCGI